MLALTPGRPLIDAVAVAVAIADAAGAAAAAVAATACAAVLPVDPVALCLL